LALHPERQLSVSIDRGPPPKEGTPPQEPAGPVERITMAVGPAQVRDLGMAMTMGKVAGVQSDSPAEAAGILPGDTITHVDGRPVGDPLTLPDRLRLRAWQEPVGTTVTLGVIRPERPKPLDIPVKLRRADWYEVPLLVGNPVSVPALGVAYDVTNHVSSIGADGPAARAGVRQGDVVVKAKLIPPDDDAIRQLPHGEKYLELGVRRSVTVDLGKEPKGWPVFFETMQGVVPGGTVELTLGDGRTVTMQPVPSPGWFHPERGFSFEPKTFFSGGQSLALAMRLGTRETVDSMTLVYRFLGKLGTQISLTGFAGPGRIFEIAYLSASQGLGDLLMFLTLIGANLAVINFLPIPVLDGGHMVFLAYEGITGKPPTEKVHLTLTYLGLLFILALMAWVIGLDIMHYASVLWDKVF
jgi:regulator of sigma E protease